MSSSLSSQLYISRKSEKCFFNINVSLCRSFKKLSSVFDRELFASLSRNLKRSIQFQLEKEKKKCLKNTKRQNIYMYLLSHKSRYSHTTRALTTENHALNKVQVANALTSASTLSKIVVKLIGKTNTNTHTHIHTYP